MAVIGAGPAGLVAALALARLGLEVTIAAPAFDPARTAADTRTTAVLGGSVNLLQNLGIWPDLADRSAPLRAIRVVDDMGGVLRAPEVVFSAAELRLDSFGANVVNADLVAALVAAAGRGQQGPGGRINWVPTSAVTAVEARSDTISSGGSAGSASAAGDGGSSRLTLAEGGCVAARLIVAADGRQSIGRRAAGIAATDWKYPQAAIACCFGHQRPHRDISTELHRPGGPLTTVPMPDRADGHWSSLVWVEKTEAAEELARLSDGEFRASLETRLQGLLGRVGTVQRRAKFPLSGLSAERMAARGIALVGEAGHVLPPIGAQGLNLGFRDAAALADAAADAMAAGTDIGCGTTLQAYGAARARDTGTKTWMVDLLNRSLIHDIAPVQAARGLGLHALAAFPMLKRLAMRGGLEAVGTVPRLMRPREGA